MRELITICIHCFDQILDIWLRLLHAEQLCLLPQRLLLSLHLVGHQRGQEEGYCQVHLKHYHLHDINNTNLDHYHPKLVKPV